MKMTTRSNTARISTGKNRKPLVLLTSQLVKRYRHAFGAMDFGPCSMGPYPPLWGYFTKDPGHSDRGLFVFAGPGLKAFGPLDMCSWFHLSTCSRPPQGLSHRRRCDILHTVTSRTGSRRHPHPVYRHHACITAYGIIGEHRPADQLYKENIIHMADTANTNTNAWLPALKAAFPLTIPICLGFLFLGA